MFRATKMWQAAIFEIISKELFRTLDSNTNSAVTNVKLQQHSIYEKISSFSSKGDQFEEFSHTLKEIGSKRKIFGQTFTKYFDTLA